MLSYHTGEGREGQTRETKQNKKALERHAVVEGLGSSCTGLREGLRKRGHSAELSDRSRALETGEGAFGAEVLGVSRPGD